MTECVVGIGNGVAVVAEVDGNVDDGIVDATEMSAMTMTDDKTWWQWQVTMTENNDKSCGNLLTNIS